MQQRKRIIVALAVLLAGGAVAWQFRKAVAPHQDWVSGGSLPPSSMEFLPPVGPATAPSVGSVSQRPVRTPQPKPLTDPGPGAPPTTARLPQFVETAKPQAPPDASVPQLSTSFAGSLPHEARPVSPTPEFDHPDAPTKFFGGDAPGEQPTHKITDGDTLIRLAERYLGSGDRWRELYDYNRDVLSAPDLLPLGAELRIPPHVALQTSPAPSSAAPVQNIAQDNPAGANGTPGPPLVAVDAPPMNGDPRFGGVRRLPPIAESSPTSSNKVTAPIAPVARVLRLAPQTYTVQLRDTLAAIAQKLYGDARQATTLFEANRDRLRQGEDPPAGMVLVVPTVQ